jgi:vitamin B12 transport system ATP-binding protein
MIHISNLSVGNRLLPLSVSIEPGTILHILGANGSGKSTLLSAVAGVVEYSGSIYYNDTNLVDMKIERIASYRSYLAQNQRPVFNLDVFQYLELSLPKSALANNMMVNLVVKHLVAVLGIGDKLHRSIHELSGGEWQRVRLAGSALQIWPSLNPYALLWILDEPGAPLDVAQQNILYKLIREVADMGVAIIMANHDLNRTLHNADSVLLLKQGVMQAYGETEAVVTKENIRQVFSTEVIMASVGGKDYLIFD